jgi:hypothetical protein
MKLHSRVRLFAVLLIAGAVGSPSRAQAQFCNGFAYGNAGFGAGYSTFVSRGWGYGGSGCFPRVACWRPCWRPCRPFCGPGFSFGWPGYGFGGWAGSSAYYGTQSVYLSAPYGGGATFFSGGIVPYPVPYAVPYPVPYVAPWYWFGSNNRAPAVAGQALAVSQAPATRAIAPRPPVTLAQASPSARLRVAHPASRRRAADLVATGDRQLCEAAGDVRLLKAAAESYRRAAAAAADDPDIHIRHAIALAAAGRPADADAAAQRAVMLDGRLGPEPGDRGPDRAAPLVARGMTILREIAAADPAAEEPIARLAADWAQRAAGPLTRLAAVSGSR